MESVYEIGEVTIAKFVASGLDVAMGCLVYRWHVVSQLVAGRLHHCLASSRHEFVSDHIVDSFVLHYTDIMARPRGRTKPARLTVNLDRRTYVSLVELAKREDVSVSWVVRRAIERLLARDRANPVAPVLGSRKRESSRAGSREIAP